eukprot:2034076-Rhodomonas_salina.2
MSLRKRYHSRRRTGSGQSGPGKSRARNRTRFDRSGTDDCTAGVRKIGTTARTSRSLVLTIGGCTGTGRGVQAAAERRVPRRVSASRGGCVRAPLSRART